MAGKFAEATAVPVGRSRDEIERTIKRYGAHAFVFGEQGRKAAVGFLIRGRHVRFVMPMPDPESDEFQLTPSGKRSRTEEQARAEYERAVRSRWRALGLIIKAKLEAVDSGVVEFDVEFMAQLVMADGRTVGEVVAAQLPAAIESGRTPALLPGGH